MDSRLEGMAAQPSQGRHEVSYYVGNEDPHFGDNSPVGFVYFVQGLIVVSETSTVNAHFLNHTGSW